MFNTSLCLFPCPEDQYSLQNPLDIPDMREDFQFGDCVDFDFYFFGGSKIKKKHRLFNAMASDRELLFS